MRRPCRKFVLLALTAAMIGGCEPPTPTTPASGSLDTTFKAGGAGSGWIFDSALQGSDQILLVGGVTRWDTTAIASNTTYDAVVRVTADGALDTSLDTRGVGANSYIWCCKPQADGKVLLGGNFDSYNGVVQGKLIRLNVDGSVDSTFVTGTGPDGQVEDIVVQADGKIIIGGGFGHYNGVVRANIVRLNADGSLDATFVPPAINEMVIGLALQSDGKVLAVGRFNAVNAATVGYLTRLNSDGSVDTGFSAGTGADWQLWAVTVQGDGRILVGGDFGTFNGTTRQGIVRLSADGSLDAAFDPQGTGTWSNGAGGVWAIALQADGKILIGGKLLRYDGVDRSYFARLNADGTLDTGFDPGLGPNLEVRSILVQSTGKIIIIGDFGSYDAVQTGDIARINP